VLAAADELVCHGEVPTRPFLITASGRQLDRVRTDGRPGAVVVAWLGMTVGSPCAMLRSLATGCGERMTDEEIRAIFDELRRVGADLGRPPGLALGTGFGPGEFLSWLRSLPEALGHDAFAKRLSDHVAAAAPLPNRPAANAAPKSSREPDDVLDRDAWPSVKQIELAAAILSSEWDPLGARLGTLTPEDVDYTAFEIVGGMLVLGDDPRREAIIAEELGDREEGTFQVRRSPIEQRRYLARRLCAAVDAHPAPPLPLSRAAESARTARQSVNMSSATAKGRSVERHGLVPSAKKSSQRVELGPTGFEPAAPLDPTAICAECGKIGTVAFITRDIEPRLSQYCRDCWPAVRQWAWDIPRFNRDTSAGMIEMFNYVQRMQQEQLRSAGSAVWEDRFILIEQLLAASPADKLVEDRDATLRAWARGLVDHAGEMDGPMPARIEAFIREYDARDA
jgi:hypothetical protein